MNINRVFAWFCAPFGFIVVLFIAGCATSKPLVVDTWCNPQFSPKRTDKIALTDQPNPTPQTKALDELLVDELQREGFQVVSSDRADYLLACVMDEAVKTQPVVHTYVNHAALAHQQSDRQIAPSYDYVQVERRQTGNFRFIAQSIRLLLYTNPKIHHGDFELAWQGNIDVNHSVSAGQEQVLLKTLLNYFGQQKNGRVVLAPAG